MATRTIAYTDEPIRNGITVIGGDTLDLQTNGAVSDGVLITVGIDGTAGSIIQQIAPSTIEAVPVFTVTQRGQIGVAGGSSYQVAGPGAFQFVNNGLVAATMDSSIVVVGTAGQTDATFVNDGQVAVYAGSTVQIQGTTAGSGSVLVDTSAARFYGDVTGSMTFELISGRVQFDAAASGTVSFQDGAGVLAIDTSAAYGLTLDAFAVGDKVELGNARADAFDYDGGSHTLTVSFQGAPVVSFNLAGGTYTTSQFILDKANPGNFVVELTAPCYATGTLILGEHGEVPVEALRPGDRVVTVLGGGLSEILWVGHRTVDLRTRPQDCPVRIAAGALGDGLPRRALLLSPEHALLIDGQLVPAGLLVNGTTIIREARSIVTYYHVELPVHDCLLAEGAAAESWLDTGNRAMFANSPIAMLEPEKGAAYAVAGCATLVTGGAALQAVRARLAPPAYALAA